MGLGGGVLFSPTRHANEDYANEEHANAARRRCGGGGGGDGAASGGGFRFRNAYRWPRFLDSSTDNDQHTHRRSTRARLTSDNESPETQIRIKGSSRDVVDRLVFRLGPSPYCLAASSSVSKRPLGKLLGSIIPFPFRNSSARIIEGNGPFSFRSKLNRGHGRPVAPVNAI